MVIFVIASFAIAFYGFAYDVDRQSPNTINKIATIVTWSAFISAMILVIISVIGSLTNVFLKRQKLFKFCVITVIVAIALSIVGVISIDMTIPSQA